MAAVNSEPSAVVAAAINSAEPNAETPHTPAPHRWLADGCLLLTAVMWGINIPVVKHCIANVDPFAFNAVRLVFSSLTLSGLAWLEFRQLKQRPAWRQWPWGRILIFASLTGLAYQWLFMLGIKRTTAANAALLLSAMPMWTAVISMFWLHERLKRITWLGLSVTFAGTLMVILSRDRIDLSSAYFWGNLLMLCASCSWAIATVLSRDLLKGITPLQLTWLASITTTPIHWLIVFPQIPEAWPVMATPSMLAALIYSGALSTGVAYFTWNIGVRILGGSHAAVYQNVVTLVAVSGGWIALREAPLPAQIAGGLLIIVGLLIMRRGRPGK